MEPSKEKRIADYVQFLQKGRTMTQRFRLPMDAEQAYEYLLAANMAEVQFRHRRFIHTDSVEDQLRQMADWLTADSPKFGIVLCGGCGNGKTTMLKAIQNLLNHLNIRNPNARSGFSDCYGLPVVDALHIANLCKTNHDKFLELARYDMLGIDDLGVEPMEVMSYGNIMNPVIELLSKRYDAQLFTIVTTNLQPRQIRERYGERIADRLNEMMAKIVYRNTTYRTDESQIVSG